MTKKMIAWIGAALLAGALAVACGGKQTPAETTPPPTGGETYGTPTEEAPPAEAPAEGEATPPAEGETAPTE